MKTLQITFLLGLIALAGVGVWVYGKPLLYPCSEPVTYSVTLFDPRFGISQEEFADALADAATLLNEAAGKTIVAAAAEGEVSVELVYGQEQQAAQLGQNIDVEQSAYDAKRSEVEALRSNYQREEPAFDAANASYERQLARYEADVAYWNAQGGAPQPQYAELEREGRELDAQQKQLAKDAERVNALASRINDAVEELNRLARALNAKVSVYNEQAGDEFDQGRYISDAQGERIVIYEFTDGVELRRVLAHEFGHALGMDHVENPESILYSFNIGSDLELTPEDLAELKSVCRLE